MEQNLQPDLDQIAEKANSRIGRATLYTALAAGVIALAAAGCTSSNSGGGRLRHYGWELQLGGEGHHRLEQEGHKAYEPGELFDHRRTMATYDPIFNQRREEESGRNIGHKYAPVRRPK